MAALSYGGPSPANSAEVEKANMFESEQILHCPALRLRMHCSVELSGSERNKHREINQRLVANSELIRLRKIY